MENNLEFLKDFISNGLSIDNKSNGSFEIFTIRTQHFNVNSLSELTYDRFVQEEINQIKRHNLQLEFLKPIDEWVRQEANKHLLELLNNKVD